LGRKSETTDTDKGFKKAAEAVKSMKGSYVDVGYWGEKHHPADDSYTMVGIATVHEYGYPKGKIPERSFIRSTVDQHRAKYQAKKKELALRIVDGKITTQAALSGMGEIILSDIQVKISSKIPPPLTDHTKAHRKHGGDTPLIDTGTLRASIQTRVVLQGRVVEEKETA